MDCRLRSTNDQTVNNALLLVMKSDERKVGRMGGVASIAVPERNG